MSQPNYFSNLMKAARAFEYIAATGAMGSTPVPGEDSFTRALIFALETLVKEKSNGRFTSVDLVSTINRAPHFPKHQEPKLAQRFNHSGRIMLHPLKTPNLEVYASMPNADLRDHRRRHTLTLHFELSTRMDSGNLELFGKELNQVFMLNNFGVNNVRWGGMKPVTFAQVANTLVTLGRRKRATSSGAKSLEQPPAALEMTTPSSTDARSPLTQDSIMKSPITQPTEISRNSSPSDARGSNEEPEGPRSKRQKRRYSVQDDNTNLLKEVGSCHKQNEKSGSSSARKRKGGE